MPPAGPVCGVCAPRLTTHSQGSLSDPASKHSPRELTTSLAVLQADPPSLPPPLAFLTLPPWLQKQEGDWELSLEEASFSARGDLVSRAVIGLAEMNFYRNLQVRAFLPP